MKSLKFNFVLVIFYLLSSFIFAQNKWSAEFRPSISFPTEDLGDSNIETGFGFEFAVSYRFMEHLYAYAGWSYNTFSIEDFDVDFDETGYAFGFQYIHFLGASEDLSYLLRAGAIYSHLELEDREGDFISDSGHGLGWQVETGLDYILGDDWSLRPSIRYRLLSRDLMVSQNQIIKMDLNCLSFGLGVSKSF